MASTTICTPTAMMMKAIIMVVMRSILARWAVSLWWEASFSLMRIMKPARESIKLCKASEVIAREPEISPTMILKKPRMKLVAMKR